MKKITSLMLVMVMMLSLAVPAFAGEVETLNERLQKLTQDGTIKTEDGNTIFWREFNDLNKTIKLFEDVITYSESKGENADTVHLLLNALTKYKSETGQNTVTFYDIRDGELITDINEAESYLVTKIPHFNEVAGVKTFNDVDAVHEFIFEGAYKDVFKGWRVGDTVSNVQGIAIRQLVLGKSDDVTIPIVTAFGDNQDAVIQRGQPNYANPASNGGKGFLDANFPTPEELGQASNISFFLESAGINLDAEDRVEFYVGVRTQGLDSPDDYTDKIVFDKAEVIVVEEEVPMSQLDVVEEMIEEVPDDVIPNTEPTPTPDNTNPVEKSNADNPTGEPVETVTDENPDPEPQPKNEDPSVPVVPLVVVALAGLSIFTFTLLKREKVAVYSRSEDVEADEILLGNYKFKNKDDFKIDLTDTLDLLADKQALVISISENLKGRMFGNEIIVIVNEAEKTVKLNEVDLGDKTVYEAVITKEELLR